MSVYRHLRWVRWLIPKEWRDTVVEDIEDDRRRTRRSPLWSAQQAARVGVRLRVAVTGGAVMTDLRYVVRALWRSRWFTATAAMMLALGIGTNLAVFSIVDRALFRPLPFHDEGRLVLVIPYSPATGQRFASFHRGLFVAARTGIPAIEDMAYVSSFPPSSLPVPGDAGPALVMSGASYNLLDVLGTQVVRGRGFTRAAAEGREAIAVITFETWQSRFQGDDAVIGRTIGVGPRARTIVGVLPAGFIRPALNHWGRSDGLVLDHDLLEAPGPGGLSPGVARLSPGATRAQAFAQVTALAERLDAELRTPGQAEGPRVEVEALRAGMFTASYRYLWIVTLAATLVVCLTAANLSGLLLGRGRSRMRDVALRSSLGASRGRLLTTEFGQSLVISGIGAVVALGTLSLVDHKLVELVPTYLRPFVLGGVDSRVIVYALVLVCASTVVAAGVPAWVASRTSLLVVLQSAAGASSHQRAGRLGQWVVGFEAAVGVVLVAGAAIVLRSFLGLATQDLGFSVEGLQEVRIQPTGERRGGDDVVERARYLAVLEHLRARPEIAAAAAGDSTPGGGTAPMQAPQWDGRVRAGLWQVTDGWVEMLGARLVAGESIRAVDVAEERSVAVITRDLARQLWPDASDQEVLGQRLVAPDQPERRIIGVLAEMRQAPGRPLQPMVITPIAASGFWMMDFLVRTTAGQPLNTQAILPSVQSAGVVSDMTARPAGSTIDSVLQQPRLQTIIFGGFAVIGLLVAMVGLFAMLSFDLTWRRRELGVRVSLGATSRDLVRDVMVTALRPVVIGAAVGVAVTYWAAEVVRTLVVGVDVRDPWTLGLVVVALFVTASLAAWLPARQASRVDPVAVLREP